MFLIADALVGITWLAISFDVTSLVVDCTTPITLITLSHSGSPHVAASPS